MITAPAAKQLVDELSAEPRAAGSDADQRASEKCKSILEPLGFKCHYEPFEFKTLSLRSGVANNKSANLVAVRSEPSLWLVAHSDSKSQLMPPIIRVLAAATFVISCTTLVALLIVNMMNGADPSLWPLPVYIALVSLIPLFLNPIGNNSHGAVDNASGMAAVLLAVQALPKDLPLGVLITSAEERFMAGARNFVKRHAPSRAINCDGLDDVGALRCWYNRGQQNFAESVAPNYARPVPLGILLDATILAKHGWEVVTVSKGNWNTLRRIHTAKDVSIHLSGEGIAEGAELIRDITQRLLASRAS